MRTATLITTGSLLALVVALIIGASLLRSDVEELGRDTAGITAQAAGRCCGTHSRMRRPQTSESE